MTVQPRRVDARRRQTPRAGLASTGGRRGRSGSIRSQRLAVLELAPDARSARLVRQVATSAERVFTTGAEARGQLLLVDSQFEESRRDSEVVARRFPS